MPRSQHIIRDEDFNGRVIAIAEGLNALTISQALAILEQVRNLLIFSSVVDTDSDLFAEKIDILATGGKA